MSAAMAEQGSTAPGRVLIVDDSRVNRMVLARTLDGGVLGEGWDLDTLRMRARTANPTVTFAGFSADVARELTAADPLVHLGPAEPFGLAILEAMVAGERRSLETTFSAAARTQDYRRLLHGEVL